MNQKGISSIVIILIIVGVLVAAGGGVYLYHRYFFGSNQIPEVKLPDKWQVCESDSDCVETQFSCCACGSGGTSTGINKEYLENWETKLKQDCKDTGCIALFNCKQGKTICQNNKCEFVIQEDETTGWQTYRNEEYGFEVKYPKDWSDISKDYEKALGKYSFSNLTKDTNEDVIFVITLNLEREMFDVLQTLKPGEEVEKNLIIYKKIEDLNIGGLSAVKYSADRSAIPAVSLPIGDEILIKNGPNFFHFVLIGLPEARNKNELIFTQILSTFKFTK